VRYRAIVNPFTIARSDEVRGGPSKLDQHQTATGDANERARPRVVIIGAGFAGLAAVRELAGSGADVTLVDRNVYSTFQPLLYQVATGGLNPGDVAYSVRGFLRNRGARFRHGTVSTVDHAARKILFEAGGALEYDYLLISIGVNVNHFGIPGAHEHSRGLYTRADAIALRDELMGALERYATGRRPDQLAVVIVGGGATGVEMAGTLAELRTAGLANAYPEINPARVRVILVEMTGDLLGPFHPKLRAYALKELRRRHVDVRLNTAIAEVQADEVVLSDGERLPSNMTVWAAGVSAPSYLADWGLPQREGGRLAVGPDLRVDGHDRIFAAGDIACIDGQVLPQVAQPAIQAGAHFAGQIKRIMAERPLEAFRYHDKGSMATIGRGAAVVEMSDGRFLITGVPAWLAWLALHVVTLLGGRNRISALLNLSWRYLAWPSGSGVIVGDVKE
jgi:NADH dehydrogenase